MGGGEGGRDERVGGREGWGLAGEDDYCAGFGRAYVRCYCVDGEGVGGEGEVDAWVVDGDCSGWGVVGRGHCEDSLGFGGK